MRSGSGIAKMTLLGSLPIAWTGTSGSSDARHAALPPVSDPFERNAPFHLGDGPVMTRTQYSPGFTLLTNVSPPKVPSAFITSTSEPGCPEGVVLCRRMD